MKTKQFAFLESNTTGSGHVFIKKALELGFEVLFLTQNPDRYPFLKKLDINIIVADTLDQNLLISKLKSYDQLAGLMSTSEYYIEMAAMVAIALGLPGNNVNAIKSCRNKHVFYRKLENSRFNIPLTWFFGQLDSIFTHKNQFIYPVIVKPILGTGSIGVKKCNNLAELLDHAAQLFNETQNERGQQTEKGILIQNFIVGREFSAELLINHDKFFPLGITAKHTTNNNYFIETGHDFPAVLDIKMTKKIWDTLKNLLSFLGYTFGPVHIEFKIQNNEVILIEVNPRLAGGMIPELICRACEIDLYTIIILLYSNQEVNFTELSYNGASIRFFVPKQSGLIVQLSNLGKIKELPNIIAVHLTKNVGDRITIHHDYRDRIGYLISSGQNSVLSGKIADEAFQQFSVEIACDQKGRLSEKPNPTIMRILQKTPNDEKTRKELLLISEIDLAHLLMLYKENILPLEKTSQIIREIYFLRENLEKCLPTLDFSRGNYYAYENYLTQKLGIEISGNNHIARSRNDINATLFYLTSRALFIKIYKKIVSLCRLLIEKAILSTHVPLPVYSQHQPATPGNYSFYLLAVHHPVLRILEDLQHISRHMNQSPLGCGTGSGTEIPINALYVAQLLGFESTYSNALDAIANRDFALRYKSILANLSVIISRIAQDYQLWTTVEFDFFELPDSICGSSSMMPQKKNPYILEIIKSKTMDLIAHLFGTFGKMHKVPIGNSIEVTSAAYDNIETISNESLDILDLLILVIGHAKPKAENMIVSHQKGITYATHIANQIMKNEGCSFREAHLKVGNIIKMVKENQTDPFESFLKYLDPTYTLSKDMLIYDIIDQLKFGSGPASSCISDQIKQANNHLNTMSDWLTDKENTWNKAKIRLFETSNTLLKSAVTKYCITEKHAVIDDVVTTQ